MIRWRICHMSRKTGTARNTSDIASGITIKRRCVCWCILEQERQRREHSSSRHSLLQGKLTKHYAGTLALTTAATRVSVASPLSPCRCISQFNSNSKTGTSVRPLPHEHRQRVLLKRFRCFASSSSSSSLPPSYPPSIYTPLPSPSPTEVERTLDIKQKIATGLKTYKSPKRWKAKKEQIASERSTDYSMEEIEQKIITELSSYITESTPEGRKAELQKAELKPPSSYSPSPFQTAIDHRLGKVQQNIASELNTYIAEITPEGRKAKKESKLQADEQKLELLRSDKGRRLVENFDTYILYDNIEDANRWAGEMIVTLLQQQQQIKNAKPVHVGIHVGWNMKGKKREQRVTHLLSISFPNQPVVCLQLYQMKCYDDETIFPKNVRELLQLPFISACGVGINRFLGRIKRYMHIIVSTRIEIDKLATIMEPLAMKEEIRRQEWGYLDLSENPKPKRYPSMKILCSKYLNVEIDATIGRRIDMDYFLDPLPVNVIKFATLEAYHYRVLCERLLDLYANDITKPQPSVKFQVGTKVKVYLGSRMNHAAEGIIEYLGGVNGESVQFGEKMINDGHALVRIVEVLKWEKIPTYPNETFMVYGLHRASEMNLSKIFASELPIIAVHMKQLVRMDEIDKSLSEPKKVVKQLSKHRLKKAQKRRKEKKMKKQEKADTEAKSSNYWFV